MADVELEAARSEQRLADRRGLLAADLPGRATDRAVQVTVLSGREDVELLTAIGAEAVAHEPKLLEHIQRAVHRRWDRRRISRPAPFHQLARGDVAIGLGKYLDDSAALRCPAQPTIPQALGDSVPGSRQ